MIQRIGDKVAPASIKLGIAACSNFHRVYEADEPLHDPREDLKALLREPLRRSDRFIQLALLGSAQCLRDQHAAEDCALILTSHYGPISNNALVQQQLCVERQTPKPIHFVNTLGNAAGFYIARNLDLKAANHFVSGRHGGFVDAVLLAAMLLRSGTSQVLLGAVDECVQPKAQHRQRIGASNNAALAEGSHWILLTMPDGSTAQQQLRLHNDVGPASKSLLPMIHYGSEVAGNITAFCSQQQLTQWSFADATLTPYGVIEVSRG